MSLRFHGRIWYSSGGANFLSSQSWRRSRKKCGAQAHAFAAKRHHSRQTQHKTGPSGPPGMSTMTRLPYGLSEWPQREKSESASTRACEQSSSDACPLFVQTLERTRDLPGRVADAHAFRAKLLAARAGLVDRLDRLERLVVASTDAGHDFVARRSLAEARTLREELDDIDALFVELDRVFRRLRREQRLVTHRLQTFTFGDTKQFGQAR